MKYKNSLLIVPVALGAMNIASVVHAADKSMDKATLQQEQGQGLNELQENVSKSVLATTEGKTYVADKDTAHAQIVGTPTITSDTGQKVGANYTSDTTFIDLGIQFDYKFNNLKKGDQIIIPYTADLMHEGSNLNFFGQNNVTKGALQGAGSDERGMIFKVIKDVPGELTGTVKLGARTGNSRPIFGLKMNAAGDMLAYQPVHLYYGGKLVSTFKTSVEDRGGYNFYENGYQFSSTIAGVGSTMGVGNYVNYDSYTNGAHLPSTPVFQTSVSTVKNDTFIGTSHGAFNTWFYAYNKDADKVFNVPVFTNGTKTYNGIHKVSNEFMKTIKYVDLEDGLTLNQVKAEASKYTGIVNAMSISKDGHTLTSVMYISDPAKYGPKLKDTQDYIDLGATSGVDFFDKAIGIKYTGAAATKVNDMMNKRVGNISNYLYGMFANGAIDHDVDTTHSVTNVDGVTSENSQTHINASSMMQVGQSQVQARYVNTAGKDIAEAGEPVIGWPKGSKNNPTGADKGTVQSEVIKGYVLTGKPTGAKTTTPYAVTVDFPKDGETTTETYKYTPIAKFVTDEASVKSKMPGYVNDDKDSAKIKQSYTIPYVKGKKAQGPDGKDLKLVNANDRTKGYVAPTVKDATKDTKINYVADTVKMTVKYVDKANKDSVIATNTVDGINGDKSVYSTANEIKILTGKGYKLVKDGYPKDHVYNGNETFTVEMDHDTIEHTPETPNGMGKDQLETNISQTINYYAVENNKKTPLDGVKSNVQSVKYTNKIWTDAVTGAKVKEDGWKTAKNHYDAVSSPVVHGWKTDKTKVDAKTVKQTDKNSTIEVDYVKDVGDITVNYIDKNNHDKVIVSQKADGINDEASTYSTANEIKELTKKGYHLIKDGYPKGHKYHNSEVFVVELDHATTIHTPDDPKGMDLDKLTKNVAETINYWKQTSDKQTDDNEDTTSSDESVDEKSAQATSAEENSDTTVDNDHQGLEKIDGKEFETNIQSLKFTKTITTDNVTGGTTSETPWTSKDNKFKSVDSPELEGYTADHLKIAEVDDVKPTDKNIVQDVIYKAGEQKVKVTYINDSESDESKKVIKEDGLTGKSDQKLDYSTKESIDKIESDGYKLTKDGFPKDGVTLDHDDKADQNYEVHFDKVEKELSHTGSTNFIGQMIDKLKSFFK